MARKVQVRRDIYTKYGNGSIYVFILWYYGYFENKERLVVSLTEGFAPRCNFQYRLPLQLFLLSIMIAL